MTVVAVSTHIDDVVFSCFGALGPDTTVVTALAGLPPNGVLGGWDREGGASSSHARVEERRQEDANALLGTGSGFVHLDFPDSQYWGLAGIRPPTPAELAEALLPHLADADTVLAPAGILNTDHKLVRDAALMARPDAALYTDLPYGLLFGYELPEDVAADGRKRREVQLEPSVLARKIAASRCYATQLEQLFQVFGRFLDGDALGLEVLWLR